MIFWLFVGEEPLGEAGTPSYRAYQHPASASRPRGDVLAVRCYLRYALSYRDVEELLAERGLIVDHVTVYMCTGGCDGSHRC